jgi:hypothetical protein
MQNRGVQVSRLASIIEDSNKKGDPDDDDRDLDSKEERKEFDELMITSSKIVGK